MSDEGNTNISLKLVLETARKDGDETVWKRTCCVTRRFWRIVAGIDNG